METENIETIEEQETTYDKGKKLENEFAVFMKKELGWSKIRVGAHLKGSENSKGAGVDVIAERLDQRGKIFEKIGIVWLFLGFLFSVYGIIWSINEWDNNGFGFIIFSIVFIFCGIIFMSQSNKYNKENALVECKNLKGKVNISQIDKTIREFNDYKKSNDRNYKFEYHYFVSANGYIENALKYAVDKGIICYQKDGPTFKKVGYWD